MCHHSTGLPAARQIQPALHHVSNPLHHNDISSVSNPLHHHDISGVSKPLHHDYVRGLAKRFPVRVREEENIPTDQ